MKHLNIDFKGPLPSSTRNKYFLCIVDEYLRFSFCYAYADMSVTTVIKCFNNLFYTHDHCNCVHLDHWSAFQCPALKKTILWKGE